MSRLIFDGAARSLTLFDSKGKQIGHWHANNVVDHRATLRFVPNHTFQIVDKTHPLRHSNGEDTLNGAFGRFGIIRLQSFNANGRSHSGVGIHSGRANRGGADHATMGCIRTGDEAMEAIVSHMLTDPLTTITVHHNQAQVNTHRNHPGDHHST